MPRPFHQKDPEIKQLKIRKKTALSNHLLLCYWHPGHVLLPQLEISLHYQIHNLHFRKHTL